MRNPIRLLVLGTGQMGAGIARLALKKPGLELVGACARRTERAGMDLGPVIGLDFDLGITIGNDLDEVITSTRPDVAIQATCSTLADAKAEITSLIKNGVNVISIAEEMAFPACVSPDVADDLNARAVRHGVSLLGTGINPGFVLDTLVIALTGVCADVTSISATRVNDLTPYGPSVLSCQGVGRTPEEFAQGLKDHTVVGHIGFPQSVHLIAKALGWVIDRVEEVREPIISKVQRRTEFITVEPGHVAGCLHTVRAYKDDKPVITLLHPQQVLPDLEGVETGDSIEIFGTPDIKLSGSPEIPGGQGTVAIAVNSIPHVLDAAPGLHTMIDLPIPSAALSEMRMAEQVSSEQGAKGTWVEIHAVILAAGERAPQVPDDTQQVPLEMRAKGFLTHDATMGEMCEITTAADRCLNGVLSAINPSYEHGFGAPLPELTTIGTEVRALLRKQEGKL